MSTENELGELPDEALIETSQQVEALNSDLRLRILKLASRPASVRQIADQMAMPITRLYYHVNLLEAAGYLHVVDSRKSGARIEKIYRVAARNFTPGPKLTENLDDVTKSAAALAGLIMGPARAGAEAALATRLRGGPLDGVIGRSIVDLTAEQFEHFRIRLEELVADASKAEAEPGAETQPYSLTTVLLAVEPESSKG
ncbi:MAG: helix-turn-helix transcriptional regulator [bacterium]|nr:helix-turn-helix transcriptional regulator [bacterium]